MKKKIIIAVIIIIAIVVIWKIVSHHEREVVVAQQPQYSQQADQRQPEKESFVGNVASSFGHAAVRGAGTYAGYEVAKGVHGAVSNAWGKHKERKVTKENNKYPHDSSVYPSHHSSHRRR